MSTKDFFLWPPCPCLNLCLWRSTEVKMIFIGTKKKEEEEKKGVNPDADLLRTEHLFIGGPESVESKNMKLLKNCTPHPE